MNLIQWGDFTLHAGQRSKLKIDCDALSDKDWNALAQLVSGMLEFQDVIGIATGGDKFAAALKPYCTYNPNHMLLIVDDVYTTGQSMKNMKALCENAYGQNIQGVVVFARNPPPNWINPIFFLHPDLTAV